ncbi:acyltransferase family protein [Actinoplanes sp. NBRC 103695]|uniref:acyltransferase family protein n=1 Tax=Actinoplanes sp. NBRC 103695 TaxID=3032202 RepID=UPI0024A26394|nr:acyltransferase family protein [Actinoplanes sp. NBRC 103695]GLY94631.1 acyltransferase [Actinoplanes sp. NBRC 103695]
MTVTRVVPRQPAAAPPTGSPPRATGHRRDIEGLRAVAVLLVVLYHAGVPLLGGGFVGVDVFFVISGYLITGLLAREVTGSGRLSVAGFYARRFLRLLPAAVLVTAATVVAAAHWLPPLRTPQIAGDGLFATLYSVNYRLAATGADYLNAETAPSPLQHFWSLAVEEQFYLVWPLLLLAAWAAGRRRGVAIALGVVVAGSFAVSLWQTGANPTWAYFGLHTRAWELGAGALVAVLAPRFPRRFASALSAAGLAAIALAAVLLNARTPFPGYAAALPVAGAVAVLAGGITAPSGLLREPVLQAVGRLSYSWYLWHWPFLVIGPAALGVPATLPVKLALAAASLVAASLTYALVENPIRRLPALRRRPWPTLAAGLAVTVLAAAGYLAATRVEAEPATAYRAPVLTAWAPDRLAEGVRTPAVPANLTPPLRTAGKDLPRLYPDGCSSELTDDTVRKPCAYGDVASSETVVLYGDSHAAHWFPALEVIARDRNWRLVVVTKNACSAAATRIFQVKLNRPFNECMTWRRKAWSAIADLRPSRVFMASAAAGGTVVDGSGVPLTDPTWTDRAWLAGWAETTDRLSSSGARLFLLEDTPYQSSQPLECLSLHPKNPHACVVAADVALLSPDRRRAIALKLRAKGVTVIDPTPWFCTAKACPVIVGNVLVFRDPSHMTATWSRLLAPQLAPRLD